MAVAIQRPELHVAAGVFQNDAGEVLIARRPDGVYMAGAWEFPGGKIAAGETPLQGLVRELDEELAVRVDCARHLVRFSHDYADRRVHLYVWKVMAWEGEPRGAEGQSLKWARPAELMEAGLLPADAVIVDALTVSET